MHIPLIPTTHFTAKRPLVPHEADHLFHGKSATCSSIMGAKQPDPGIVIRVLSRLEFGIGGRMAGIRVLEVRSEIEILQKMRDFGAGQGAGRLSGPSK